MPELDEKKRIIDYNTVNNPDENYYALIDNGTAGTGKVSIKGLGPANMISDAYSNQDTYAVGDVCIHNNILYVCNTEIDTPHAFDLSEWDPDTLGNYCSTLNGDVSQIKSSLSVLIGQLQQQVTNLNDPLLNGCAYITFNTYPASASNKPTGNTGIIMTYGNGRFRQQVAFELAGEIYTRYADNGSITAWTKRG